MKFSYEDSSSKGDEHMTKTTEKQWVSHAEAARWLRCSDRTVRQYVAAGTIKAESTGPGGKLDLMAAVGDVIEHQRAVAGNKAPSAATEEGIEVLNALRREQTRLAAASADIREMHRAVAASELISVPEAVAAIAAVVSVARSKLLSIPQRLGHLLSMSKADRLLLDEEVRKVLSDLADGAAKAAAHASAATQARLESASQSTTNEEE